MQRSTGFKILVLICMLIFTAASFGCGGKAPQGVPPEQAKAVQSAPSLEQGKAAPEPAEARERR